MQVTAAGHVMGMKGRVTALRKVDRCGRYRAALTENNAVSTEMGEVKKQ
jgi:hypothetical protein